MQAFVFPGQGSQYAGMGLDAFESDPSARAVFEEADDVLGFGLSRLCFEGPEEDLRLTENTQPAILTVSIALWRALRDRGLAQPAFVAGHSLGEYSALVAAGALEFDSALRLVRQRGRFMQEAVPLGQGAMAAVIGLSLEDLEAVCREAAEQEVVGPANINAPGQIVIAGHRTAVDRACSAALERGAKRARALPVSAPFHSPLMAPAQERLAQALQAVPFSDPGVPLVNNVDAEIVVSGEQARDGLVRQVSSAVLWTRSVERMIDEGADCFVEIGPKKVLTGLIKRISNRVERVNIETLQQMEQHV